MTDPFSPKYGYTMGRPQASIVTVSHEHEHHSFIGGVNGEPRVVRGPGEYEIADVLISGLRTFPPGVGRKRAEPVPEADTPDGGDGQPPLAEEPQRIDLNGVKFNTVYVIDVDGLRVCHLGDLGGPLSAEHIEGIGSIDILMVPVGGGDVVGPTQAAEVVSQLEPNMVIPMHYRIEGTRSEQLEPVERFMREMGSKSIEPVPKVSVGAKGSLPADMQVIMMEHK